MDGNNIAITNLETAGEDLELLLDAPTDCSDDTNHRLQFLSKVFITENFPKFHRFEPNNPGVEFPGVFQIH